MSALLPPCPAPFNLAAHVLRHAALTPGKAALETLDPAAPESWSFARLDAAVRGTATGLRDLGLVPGDRVLFRLGDSVDFPILYLACMAVDLVAVPTSAQLTRPEITTIAQALRPALIAAAPGVALPDDPVPVIALDALRALRSRPPAAFLPGDPDRPGYIVFTSGTSGAPRGVVHAHRAIWARQSMFDGWYGLRRDDRMMHAGAFNWTYTLGTGLMDPWSVGATALIPGAATAVSDLPALIARHQATLFAAAPGVFRQMLRAEFARMPALRHGLSAGEKLPASVAEAWRARTGTEIFEAYGMSECSTFVSDCPAAPAPPGTLGRAQPGRRVAIVGPEGQRRSGEPGTIAVAADDPGLMLGYLDDPGATAGRMHEGWFHTGDTGVMAEDGSITYLGRDDDIMTAGGYRVSPIEVEAALTGFPGLHEVAVTETEIRPGVRIIAAFYVADAALDEAALAGHCARRLARYKCPRAFVHLDAIPKSPNGKVQRRLLRKTQHPL